MTLRNIVRRAVLEVSKGGTTNAVILAEEVRTALKELGLEANCHVGKSSDFFKDEDRHVEWYAGQLLDIVDNKSWFAMNSLINCLDKFCPEK